MTTIAAKMVSYFVHAKITATTMGSSSLVMVDIAVAWIGISAIVAVGRFISGFIPPNRGIFPVPSPPELRYGMRIPSSNRVAI